ncbi:oligosaccharide repeat unit polymerase [Pedobacter sp. UYP30]|uniref:O-antigen polysaccharide polymerase Wzy n=1 Tax=Pedobacter sp. UYP30 TaxID=1756400 RepID=UPI003393B030
MQILTLILAVILYFLAPNKYDFTICCVAFALFLYSASITVKSTSRKEGFLSFTLFFTVSFFLVNFFYPIFIYPIDKYYFPVFGRFYFNEAVITKATLLALVGYCSFSVGVSYFFGKTKVRFSGSIFQMKSGKKVILKYSYKIILVLTWVLSFITFYMAREGIFQRSSDAFVNVEPSILVIAQCLVNLLIILNFYLKKPLKNLAIVIIYSLVFIYVGDRGSAVQTSLVLLLSYNLFYKKIRKTKVVFIFLAGFIGLTVVSSLRGKDGGSKQLNQVEYSHYYDFAMDLIVNNRNLYAGYDYANKNGLNYGTSSLPYIFAPIPLLPSYITTKLFNATPQQLSSGTILTNDVGATWGLGTNLIADLYMQFGFLGVLLLMFLLGRLISSLALNNGSGLFTTICYIFVCSFSIYMARSSLFDSLRYIAWAAIIYYLLFYLLKPFLKVVK